MATTTLGQHLVNDALPAQWHNRGPLTKQNLNEVLVGIAKADPDSYPETVTKLKRLGDELATLDGISVGLDDIAPHTAARDAALQSHAKAFHAATTVAAKEQALLGGFNAMHTLARNHPGTLGEMVRSGGRGNAAQLMRTVGAPVMVQDSRGKVVPWLISKSFSEGLKPADAWVAGGEARVNAVLSNISVVEPGDLAKILVNNMGDKLITRADCGTKNGISMAATDPHLIDRYLVDGRLVTPNVASQLARAGRPVLVRSPMTCEETHGVCQRCQGLSPSGHVHAIGTNIGVRAAQALSEPLTQFSLNAKHGGRVAHTGDEKRLEGIKGIRALLEIPESFAHKAVLAEHNGHITQVTKAPQGGHYVYVNETQHYIPPSYRVTVTAKQAVTAGDLLSDGVPKPDEVVRHKGLGEGRRYMVDAMSDVYKRAGSEIDKRHIEVLAKSLLNHVQVVDPGDHAAYLKGDVINYNRLHATLSANQKKQSLHDALGEPLADRVLHHTAGTLVTPAMIAQFEQHGITHVPVSASPLRVVPVMRPASRNPLFNPDWMARLAHRYLKESLLTGIHRGDVSNLHGASPIPAYAAGTEFGHGPDGGY